jgi:membrane protein CcdC involved in cytochrome C biogenesis
MATGFSMFFVPAFRIPWAWAGLAFAIGAVALAWPLLLTTRLERRGDVVMMKRSSAFLVVILVLAVIRFAARGYFDTILTAKQTAGVFFILAFGMIICWRAKMLMDFRRITTGLPTVATQE